MRPARRIHYRSRKRDRICEVREGLPPHEVSTDRRIPVAPKESVMNRKWIPLAILTILAVSSLGVVQEPPAVTGGEIDLGDTAWLLTATGLVLLMTPGLSFFYAGMVSTKNVISTMLQSFIALGVITLVWIAVGFSLCFGDSING